MIIVKPAKGDLMGVLMTPNNIAIERIGEGRIIASYAQRGNAISVHFASDKKGLRHIKPAINEFCQWAFEKYEWCTMILAMIKIPSVERLVLKCGFSYLTSQNDINIYMRVR